ncbi:hypothetical protein ACFYUV_38135 [Nonomuraea sp. NPDC003560]|uniref:hypothetical protein n=1 Tax=Nonomuraea sp. NPDC003560 TaxID=3364341 RepID=UPI0036A79284
MKIKMLTLYASAERSVQPGETAVFPNDEAEELIAGGFAVPADGAQVRTRPVPQPPKDGGQQQTAPPVTPPDTETPKAPVKAPAKAASKAAGKPPAKAATETPAEPPKE